MLEACPTSPAANAADEAAISFKQLKSVRVKTLASRPLRFSFAKALTASALAAEDYSMTLSVQ
jgi:hypothetical protein